MTRTQVALVTAGALLLPTGLYMWGAFTSVATAPARVVTRTLGTDNILHNYEWFFDVNAQFQARTAQIAAHKTVLTAEVDADEQRRLRMELAAMQQSCRDLATQYNANSQKQNRDLFKSASLPATLTCEE